MFGLYGFTLTIVFVLAQLVSINTFGAPYMACSRHLTQGFFKSVIYSKPHAPRRPVLFNTKDNTRGPVPPNNGPQPK